MLSVQNPLLTRLERLGWSEAALLLRDERLEDTYMPKPRRFHCWKLACLSSAQHSSMTSRDIPDSVSSSTRYLPRKRH